MYCAAGETTKTAAVTNRAKSAIEPSLSAPASRLRLKRCVLLRFTLTSIATRRRH